MIHRLICAFMALGGLCCAQTPLSLEDAIRKAQSQRPELQSAARRVVAGEDLRRQASLFPNPRLILQSENIRGSNFDFGQDGDTFAYLSQVFETSGRRKGRIEVASQDVQRRRLESERLRREIVFKVRLAYWNALADQATTELYRQSEDYFRQIVEYHEARLREGKLAEVDLLRVRLQAAQIRAAAQSAELRAGQAQIQLAQAMGIPEPGPWALTEKFDALENPQNLPADADVINARIEGQLVQQQAAAARAQLVLEKAKGRPDLDALFGYKRATGLNTAILGLQLNLPIFDRNQGASAAAQAEVNAAENNINAVRIQLKLETALARREYEGRLKQVRTIFGPMRDRAAQIADISRAAYKEGGLELLRLLDSEKLRVDTQLAWVDAALEYHKSVIELERAEGVQP